MKTFKTPECYWYPWVTLQKSSYSVNSHTIFSWVMCFLWKRNTKFSVSCTYVNFCILQQWWFGRRTILPVLVRKEYYVPGIDCRRKMTETVLGFLTGIYHDYMLCNALGNPKCAQPQLQIPKRKPLKTNSINLWNQLLLMDFYFWVSKKDFDHKRVFKTNLKLYSEKKFIK